MKKGGLQRDPAEQQHLMLWGVEGGGGEAWPLHCHLQPAQLLQQH